jgi:hypothetical protein
MNRYLQWFGFYLLRLVLITIILYLITYGICYYFHQQILLKATPSNFDSVLRSFLVAFTFPLVLFSKGFDYLELELMDLSELLIYNALGYAFVLAFFLNKKYKIPEINIKSKKRPLKREIE